MSERPCWCGQIHDTKYPDEHGFACPHRQPGEMECGVGVEGWDRCSHYTTQWFGDDGYYQFLGPGQCWIHERARAEAAEAEVTAWKEMAEDLAFYIREQTWCGYPQKCGTPDCPACTLRRMKELLDKFEKLKG